MENSSLRAITAPEEIARFINFAHEFVVHGFKLNIAAIRSRDWTVVPIESAIDSDDQQRLAEACRSIGLVEFFAIVLEKNYIHERVYRVGADLEAISEMSDKCEANHHILLPEDTSWVYLRPFGLYSLMAGSPTFIESVLGMSVSEAREEFRRYYGEGNWSFTDRQFLTHIGELSEQLPPASLGI